jgi:P-type Ca2+ transporter type 2C
MSTNGKNGHVTRYTAWCEPVESVLLHFDTSAEGLTSAEAQARAIKYGPNELRKEPATPLWKLVLDQFDDALVKMLLIAAFVSLVLAWFEEDTEAEGVRAFIEPFVILLILVLNAMVGVWQESNAESALEALKEMQPSIAKAVRSGALVPELPARDLVPGDIVQLVVGDKVPADCRVIHINTATLRAEQASLTGSHHSWSLTCEDAARCDMFVGEAQLGVTTEFTRDFS